MISSPKILTSSVKSATYDEAQKKWNVVVQSNAGKNFVFQPKQMIVASGENTNPNIPQFEGQHTFKGRIFHSSEFVLLIFFELKNL